MLELIINKNKKLENIILVQNGKIIENYTSTEEDKKRRLEGNIYIGQVSDIINGMQAAFIDFGGEKKGFIHLKDAVPQIDETKEKLDSSLDIKNVLKLKQKLLIQIKKDSDDKKGARVSTHISIPGKFVVLMPNTDFITISQKIEDTNKKQELKNLIKETLPKGYGAVIRTSAEKVSKEEIKKDIENILKKWNDIEKKFNTSSDTPKLLWESENIVEKAITDLSTKNLEKITTNSEEEFNKLKKLNVENIEIILDKENDLLSKYDISKQIEKLENRKIWLNCGGFITIDKTEALTAIDVNTGKFTGNKDLETTIFKVNKEATMEIAKQLRLRDIGGIIIIDYIDMKNKENKKNIENILKEALKEDRAKTQVEGFTKLNLMEMTRKHICSHLNG
jgi:ribonuclease G